MEIIEIKNNQYDIEKFKMRNDCIIKNVYPPLPSFYGFFLIICGVPNSGKTNLLMNIIKKSKKKNTYYRQFDKVYMFSNSLHTIQKDIMIPKKQLFNGIDELEEVIENIKIDTDSQNLIILDDVISDISNLEYVEKLIYNRRHLGSSVSIILTTQVFNKINLKIRKCASTIIIFSTSNKLELESIWKCSIPILSYKQFLAICKFCFKKDNHQFLCIDVQNNLFYHGFNLLKFKNDDEVDI